VGVGFSAFPQMVSLSYPFSHKQQSPVLSRSALSARDALVLEHLPLADVLASAAARRLFPLVEREVLIQVAREALVLSAPRCSSLHCRGRIKGRDMPVGWFNTAGAAPFTSPGTVRSPWVEVAPGSRSLRGRTRADASRAATRVLRCAPRAYNSNL
jgi:hypothetical protein